MELAAVGDDGFAVSPVKYRSGQTCHHVASYLGICQVLVCAADITRLSACGNLVQIGLSDDPNNIAIIGRSMDAVNGYAAALRAQGIDPYLFSSSMDAGITLPTIARKEFSFLSDAYGGTIPDSALPRTKKFSKQMRHGPKY